MNSNLDQYDPYGAGFQALICNAGLNIDTERRLLNGQRRQVSIELGLSKQEVETVMEIQAATLRDFAFQIPGVQSASTG